MPDPYNSGRNWIRDSAGNFVAIPDLSTLDITQEIVQNIVNETFVTEITENNEFITLLTEVDQFIQNIVNQLTEVDVDNTYITQVTENDTFVTNITQLLTALTEITEVNTYVTNLITQVVAQINGKKGVANELATLDGSGKLTSAQIPSSLATDAEVAAAVAALVNSAPSTLDTLKELSDALGADPNFATTLATSLAGKQPLDSDLTAIAALTTTSTGRSLLAAADAAAIRTIAGAEVSGAAAAAQAASQPLDSDLTSIAAVATTSFGRSLLALADAAALLSAAGAAASGHTHSPVVGIPWVIDGSGSVITTGLKGGFEVPFACTIIGWTILATDGLSGAIVVDVWKDSYANHPPTVADTITGSEKPTITATGTKGQDLSLNGGSGWALAAGDILFFNVDSVTTLTRVSLTLRATRTV